MEFKNIDTGMLAQVSPCDHRGFAFVVTLTDMDSGCLVTRRYCLTREQAVTFAKKATS